jgi:hypothetical protein
MACVDVPECVRWLAVTHCGSARSSTGHCTKCATPACASPLDHYLAEVCGGPWECERCAPLPSFACIYVSALDLILPESAHCTRPCSEGCVCGAPCERALIWPTTIHTSQLIDSQRCVLGCSDLAAWAMCVFMWVVWLVGCLDMHAY